MRRINLFIILTVVFIMSATIAYPIPAKPTPFVLKQADGTELTVRLRGDENFHYYTTDDGYLLLPGQNGILYYAEFSSGNVEPSAFKAKNIGQRSPDETNFLRTIRKDLTSQLLKSRQATSPQRYKMPRRKALTDYPTIGEQKALIILVEFTDRKFTIENPLEAFDDMINKPGYSDNNGTGSARDFFIENSDGQYLPEFDVFGPVTLSKKMSYYGGNNWSGNDEHPEEMVIEACKQLDGTINFADYDRDNDGVVDNVYIFYAGYGEADGGPANSVWPHAWGVKSGAGKDLILDGVRIDSYACSNELARGSGTNMNGIGTFCHEFSHVLGLPDLYATGYEDCFTPGKWSLMDYGPYNNDGKTPPYMSAFERYSLGWIEPAVVTASDTTFVLPGISENKAYLIKTEKANEYFMLENRQQESWDKYIPGHGMLLWHIDYNENVWANNVVNNTPSHQYVDIEEADGTQTESSRSEDAFPGTANKTSITDDTKPNWKSWNGSRRNLSVLNIKESDGLITFNVIDPRVKPDAPVSKEASQVSSTSFQANWEKVTVAIGYTLDVYTKTGETKNYLPGYQNKDVSGDDSLLITGLEPETDYYYVVRSTTGAQVSDDSEEIRVKTPKPGIDAFAPLAKEATSVTSGSFVANWDELEDADNYLLYVYKKTGGENVTMQTDFSDGASSLPEDWETTCSGVYTSTGFYGKASPALKFDKSGLTLQSPLSEGKITTVSFWCRGASTAKENVLLISGFDGNDWIEIRSISPIDNSAQTYTLPEDTYFDRNYYAIRFTYLKNGSGNLALDDVTIESGGIRKEMLPDYDGIPAGNVSSSPVEGLEPETEYYYAVQATDGELLSKLSNEIQVTTPTKENSIGCRQLTADDLRINSTGNRVTIENKTYGNLEVRIYTPLGECVASRSIGEGTSTIYLNAGQVYILKIGSFTYKIVL